MMPSLAELARGYLDADETDKAAACFRAALPSAGAWQSLSVIAAQQGCFAAAQALARRALLIDPLNIDNRINLALTLWKMESYGDAELELIAALEAETDANHLWRIWSVLARVYSSQGRFEEAISCFQKAVPSLPDDPHQKAIVRSGLGYALLASGDLAAGFQMLRQEWSCEQTHIWGLGIPEWSGNLSELPGTRLLVHHHQGLGDTIQFCRFLPALRGAGARVIAAVPRPLLRLIRAAELADEVIDFDDGTALRGLPKDLHVPIGLLPMHLGVTLKDLPAAGIPYLQPCVLMGTEFTTRVFHIGIAWTANPRSNTAAQRSVPLEHFLRLTEIPNVQLHVLQPQAGRSIEQLGAGPLIDDSSWALRDFGDTAALANSMDLVVSADTSLLHLAGALGVPCIGLLSYAGADWRWLDHDRDRSPWYPTMRLIRQREPGLWGEVMERAAALTVSLMN